MRPVVFRCGELFRGSRCVWAWICCVCGALRGIVPGVLLCGVVVGAGVVAGWRGGFLEIRSGAFVWEAVRGGFPGRLAGVAFRGGCPAVSSGESVPDVRRHTRCISVYPVPRCPTPMFFCASFGGCRAVRSVCRRFGARMMRIFPLRHKFLNRLSFLCIYLPAEGKQ